MHLSKKILEDSTTTPFMNKSLRKTIICRSKFKNIYNETRSNEYCDNSKNQKTSVWVLFVIFKPFFSNKV